MAYAVIQTGGKQFRVTEGEVVRVPTIVAEVGASVDFDTLATGDGDNVNIPEVTLLVQVPASVPAGEYPIRVFGRTSTGPSVEAFTTLWIGAPRKRNDTRRPLPAVTMTVIAPSAPPE